MSFLAFDLGGTRLKAGLVREDGRCDEVKETESPPANDVAAALREIGEKLLAGERAHGAGLCVPGLVEDGRVTALPGKLEGIERIDLSRIMRDAFGVEPVVCNDAIAAGVGEAVVGAGRGASRVVIVTIGTGVGVCVVEDGVPLGRGVSGGGILGGQIPIGEGGRDTSGRSGTIEALCRASRIAELAGTTTTQQAYEAAARGDDRARAGIDRYRGDLARALVALAHAHAPERIILAGGPVTGDDPIVDGLAELMRPHLFAGYDVDVRRAALGDAAALVGLSQLGGSRE